MINMLDTFFNPKSVAVIGASPEKRSIGYSILKTLKNSFKGKIYAVNPNHNKILGLKSYFSVREVKTDLAVIVVPKKIVPLVLKDCVKAKVKSVVIITAGYSEIGDKKSEEELRKIIKGSRTRILGVNCLGILDTHTGLDTLFLPEPKLKRPRKGGVSFISQSGAFGSTVLDLFAYDDVGIAKFLSYGNQTDIKDWELLEWLGNDPLTKVIVIYMEGVSDGRKFFEVSKKVSKKKPVVVFKAGKTESGSKAAASHTGSLAGSYDVYRAAFKQAGIFEAHSVEEIYDLSKALEFQKPNKGSVAVVTNGGGFGVVTSDFLIQNKVKLANFSPDTEKKLRKILPKYANIHNPLDLIGDADHKRYEKALDILIKDKNVSGLLIITLLQTVSLTPKVLDVIKKINKTTKPIVVCATGGKYTQKHMLELESSHIPVYLTPERAVKAIKVLLD